MCDVLLNYILFVWAWSCQGCTWLMDSIFVRASQTHKHKSPVPVYFMYTLQLITPPFFFIARQSENVLLLFYTSTILNCISAARTNPSSSHPPFAILNKPSSSSSSHSTTFYLCCTWEMRERGGMGAKMNETGSGEWKRAEGGGGREESKIGKNALWLDLKVCGISFSERGELHLLQIL